MATLPLQTATPCAQPISLAKSASSLLDERAFGGNPSSLDALDKVFLLVAIEQRAVDRNHARLLEFKLSGEDGFEPRLVHIADVGALLNLDHIEVFQHLEAVSAGDQQDDIACAEHAACTVFLLLRVEIDAHFAFADEQGFLRVRIPRDARDYACAPGSPCPLG